MLGFAPVLLRVRGAVRDRVGLSKKLILEAVGDDPGSAPPSSDLCYRLGTPDELAEIGRLSGESPEELSYVSGRLAAGDRFVLGHWQDQLVFSACLMFGQMELAPGTIPIASDIAYSYKVFTAPAFRGRGCMRRYYSFIRGLLPGMGYRRLIAHVRQDNVASLRAHRAAGFSPIGVMWEAYLGRHRRGLLAPGARTSLTAMAPAASGGDQ